MIKFNKKLSKRLIFISTIKKIVEINSDYNKKLSDLILIDEQKQSLLDNTISFLHQKTFSNALLWGEKGMGKSSLIQCLVDHLFATCSKKFNFLELFSHDLKYLPEIIYNILKTKNKFIIFIDDITFKPFSSDFNILKSILEGSIFSSNKNIVFYFTTNVRKLAIPPLKKELDDLELKDVNNSIFSLSERFGMSLGFYRCDKNDYLKIINFYSKKFKITESISNEALQWSILKGGYSGRIAYQFFINYFNRKR